MSKKRISECLFSYCCPVLQVHPLIHLGTFCASCPSLDLYCLKWGPIWMSAPVISRTQRTFQKTTCSSHPPWLYCTVWCQVWSESLTLLLAGENDLCRLLLTFCLMCLLHLYIHQGPALIKSLHVIFIWYLLNEVLPLTKAAFYLQSRCLDKNLKWNQSLLLRQL